MPRFVILTHDHPFPHWDFMLEQKDSLWTWRLLGPPDSAGPIPAEPLPNHRLAYLDYEGSVSGNRGTVSRWDTGTYDLVEERSAAHPGGIVVRLRGERLRGTAVALPKSDRTSEPATFQFVAD